MKVNKKTKIKGCACYGVNSIHPCFCSPHLNKNICQIPKCKRVQHSIGWCKVHYNLLMPNCTQRLNKQD